MMLSERPSRRTAEALARQAMAFLHHDADEDTYRRHVGDLTKKFAKRIGGLIRSVRSGERTRADAAEAERDRLREAVAELRAALKPFAEAADNLEVVQDGEGYAWGGREQRASIHTWFGPTDLGIARRVHAATGRGDGDVGGASERGAEQQQPGEGAR